MIVAFCCFAMRKFYLCLILGWFNPKSSCRNHRDLGERNTDPRGFPPSHAAIAHASLVKHKIE